MKELIEEYIEKTEGLLKDDPDNKLFKGYLKDLKVLKKITDTKFDQISNYYKEQLVELIKEAYDGDENPKMRKLIFKELTVKVNLLKSALKLVAFYENEQTGYPDYSPDLKTILKSAGYNVKTTI